MFSCNFLSVFRFSTRGIILFQCRFYHYTKSMLFVRWCRFFYFVLNYQFELVDVGISKKTFSRIHFNVTESRKTNNLVWITDLLARFGWAHVIVYLFEGQNLISLKTHHCVCVRAIYINKTAEFNVEEIFSIYLTYINTQFHLFSIILMKRKFCISAKIGFVYFSFVSKKTVQIFI